MTALDPYQQTPPVYRPASVFTPAIMGPPVSLATVAVFAARWWHDAGGAAHSIGDAIGAGAVAALALGFGLAMANAEKARPLVIDLAASIGAAATTTIVVGYANPLQPALFAWLGGCAVGCLVNSRRQRKTRERWEDMQAQERREQLAAATRIRLAEIAERERVQIAREQGPQSPVFVVMPQASAAVPYAPPISLTGMATGAGHVLTSGTEPVDAEDDSAWMPEWINEASA